MKQTMKNILATGGLCLAMALSTAPQVAGAEYASASPSTAKVMVNGSQVNFGAYTIEGFNYFKLTDISYALTNTNYEFLVGWDSAAGVITLTTGESHRTLGTELQGNSGKVEQAEYFQSPIYQDGALVQPKAYVINGSSYFQLDSLKEMIGFPVSWNGDTSTISITSPVKSFAPADTNFDGQVSQGELDAVFAQYKSLYPQGTKWTNSNSYFTVLRRKTDAGSVSSVNFTGYGCAGWAYMLTDAIYGNAPQYEISRSQVQAGDYWHTGDHWGVIMAVNGNNYVCTEGNYNSSIYWEVNRGSNYLTENIQYYSRR